MKVEIDGVLYLPASTLIPENISKALLRAITSGYYFNMQCGAGNQDASEHCADPSGTCSACALWQLTIQILGEKPKSQPEPLIDNLL